jgi:hypothetical protein
MYDTPYYKATWSSHFSKQEYQRRYQSLRDKMREHKLDCVIVADPATELGRWHAIFSPAIGNGMGSRPMCWCRSTASRLWSFPWAAPAKPAGANAPMPTDVRHRSGKYAEVMVERLKEL